MYFKICAVVCSDSEGIIEIKPFAPTAAAFTVILARLE